MGVIAPVACCYEHVCVYMFMFRKKLPFSFLRFLTLGSSLLLLLGLLLLSGANALT